MMTIRLIADFDNTLDDALNGVTEAGAALGRMYRAALARAEAAEAERNDANIEVALEQATAREAWQRVAELEAAQGWRPVTENPDKPGWYVVYDSDGHVFYNADIFPYRVARWTGKWDSAFNGLVDYWRPLPPAPLEAAP